MKTDKSVIQGISVIVVFVIVVVILVLSSGRDELYDYVKINKFLPIPVLHDSSFGIANLVDEKKMKGIFKAKGISKKRSRNYFVCIGYVKPATTTFFLLELDGIIYIEKDVFVLPILKALYRVLVSEEKIDDFKVLIKGLPEDKAILLQAIKNFK